MSTIVTSFLLQRDGRTTHSLDKYFSEFHRMKNNIKSNIILFLDEKIPVEKFKDDRTIVIPTKIEDTDTYNLINSINNPIICMDNNPIKNTQDFHTIINCKTEFMIKGFELVKNNKLAWVDFGIGHVIKNDYSFNKIDQIESLEDGVIIPGCWNFKTNIIDNPAWRFCGGFFVADRSSMIKMHHLCKEMIKETLPYVTWEVNIWSLIESKNNFPFKWYYGDHNDSIFNF